MCSTELSEESIPCERVLKAHLAGYDTADGIITWRCIVD